MPATSSGMGTLGGSVHIISLEPSGWAEAVPLVPWGRATVAFSPRACRAGAKRKSSDTTPRAGSGHPPAGATPCAIANICPRYVLLDRQPMGPPKAYAHRVWPHPRGCSPRGAGPPRAPCGTMWRGSMSQQMFNKCAKKVSKMWCPQAKNGIFYVEENPNDSSATQCARGAAPHGEHLPIQETPPHVERTSRGMGAA
jgi:hypothetical protein